MIPSLDSLALTIFVLVQCRITVLWWRAAGRHFSGRGLTAVRAAMLLFDAVLGTGCAYDFFEVLSRGNPTKAFLYVGAATLAYFLIATAVLAMYSVFSALRRKLHANFDPSRRRVLNVAGNVLMAAPFAVVGYGALIERLNFQVREVDVPLPNLPAALDGLRLLHLSDIHLSAFLSESDLVRVIDTANTLHPHLAVVTGDLISSPGDPLDACIRQLARLKTDAGVFGCMGNHERYAGVELRTETTAARAGIRFLRNTTAQLRFGDSTLNLAGVDYQPLFARNNYLRGAERMVQPGAVNVLLSHNPDVFPIAARQGYDLMLAGHTHGGQVSVEILDASINPARFLTPYVYGLYQSGSSAAYVTRGIGTIGLPARIGAPPEISILRLRKA